MAEDRTKPRGRGAADDRRDKPRDEDRKDRPEDEGRKDRPEEDDRKDRPEDGKDGDRKSPWDEKRILEMYRRLQRIAREKHRSTYTPWLLIRYSPTDIGARPIPSGQNYWKSPDIWVESSDPDGNAVAGEANFVHCRVFNLGMAAALPVQVDFYWADPSIGLDAPHMHPIGTEWVTIQPWQSRIVKCQTPWVPEFVNNGHECLKVNCSNWVLDPIQQPFKTRLDRHVGQRNVTVLAAAPGGTAKMMVFANNLFPIAADLRVTAQMRTLRPTKAALELPRRVMLRELATMAVPGVNDDWEIEQRFAAGAVPAQTRAALARLGRHAHAQLRQRAPLATALPATPTVGAHLLEHSRTIVPAKDSGALCDFFGADGKFSPGAVCGTCGPEADLIGFAAKPFEQRQIALEIGVPPDAREGDVVVADILLRTDRHIIGGYTAVVAVA